jgi:hypothetical protein
MLIACLKCGTRVSTKWLLLGMPWSKYTCSQCGSVLAGTALRFVLTSLAVGVLGVVLISVVKGRMGPFALVLPLAVAAAVLLLRLPGQIRKVG